MAVRDANQTLRDDLATARMTLDAQESKYLRTLGWEFVCRVDTVQFWQKTLKSGRILISPRDLAVTLETRGGFDESTNPA